MNWEAAMKNLLFCALGLLICILLGALPSGLGFLFAALLFLGRGPLPGCAELVIGALSGDLMAIVFGDAMPVFWILLATAATLVSFTSLPRAAALVAAGGLFMKAQPAFYIPFFIGAIRYGILLFTSEKKYGKISV